MNLGSHHLTQAGHFLFCTSSLSSIPMTQFSLHQETILLLLTYFTFVYRLYHLGVVGRKRRLSDPIFPPSRNYLTLLLSIAYTTWGVDENKDVYLTQFSLHQEAILLYLLTLLLTIAYTTWGVAGRKRRLSDPIFPPSRNYLTLSYFILLYLLTLLLSIAYTTWDIAGRKTFV